MLHFDWPWMFLLILVPLFIYTLLPRAHVKPSEAVWLPFYHSLRTRNEIALSAWRWRQWLMLLIWSLLTLASARPVLIGSPIITQHVGRAIMLALDLSGSMQLPDMIGKAKRHTRLQAVKTVATAFINQREGDKLGLILFGSRAYLQAPLTFDHHTVQTLLNDATIGLAGQRTAIGDAIGLAIKRLQHQPKAARVLVLLTDGVNNAGHVLPLEAAKQAKAQGIKIYTVGIGADHASFIGPFGGSMILPSSDLDIQTLKTISESTGGLFFRASDVNSLMTAYKTINHLEPIAKQQTLYHPMTPLYPWPLGLALLLSFLLGYLRGETP